MNIVELVLLLCSLVILGAVVFFARNHLQLLKMAKMMGKDASYEDRIETREVLKVLHGRRTKITIFIFFMIFVSLILVFCCP